MTARHDINQQPVDMMERNQAATTSPLQGWDMRHIAICVSNHPGQDIAPMPGLSVHVAYRASAFHTGCKIMKIIAWIGDILCFFIDFEAFSLLFDIYLVLLHAHFSFNV